MLLRRCAVLLGRLHLYPAWLTMLSFCCPRSEVMQPLGMVWQDICHSAFAVQVVMADSLGMATRLKMGSHPASASPNGQAQDNESSSAWSASPSSSPAALTQGPVLHVTQVQTQRPCVCILEHRMLHATIAQRIFSSGRCVACAKPKACEDMCGHGNRAA